MKNHYVNLLLSKVAVGDHSAFKTLYEETKNMVYFYALEITRNHCGKRIYTNI